MKQLLLIAFSFIVLKTSWGQPYQPLLGNTSTSWNIVVYAFDQWATDSLYTINEDTLIDFHHYKLLHAADFHFVLGFIRTDSSNSKMWCYAYTDNTERLCFDLNLAVGDSFYFYYGVDTGWHFVDSVYFKNSTKHVRFNLQTDWEEKFEFVEGVGPNITLDYQYPFWHNTFLLCNHHDDSLNYITNNPHFHGCSFYLGVKETPGDYLEILPNPTSQTISTKWKETGHPVDVKIYNLLGKCLLEQRVKGAELNLDLKEIANGIPGIYIMSITPTNAKQITRKLILY